MSLSSSSAIPFFFPLLEEEEKKEDEWLKALGENNSIGGSLPEVEEGYKR